MSKTSERRKRIPFFVILIVILTVAGCVAFYFFGSGSGVSGNSPVINEVLCSNSASFKAYDGRFYDWIELYNPTSSEMPLDGYYLSDDAESLTKNPLSGQTIPAKGYLVIYCSGLNLTDERGFLHTNFKLSASDGEKIYLSDTNSVKSITVPSEGPTGSRMTPMWSGTAKPVPFPPSPSGMPSAGGKSPSGFIRMKARKKRS